MNLRRYALFIVVAILTFILGVTAAVVVGGVNPFPHRNQARRGCARLTALPDDRSRLTVYTVYRSDGTVVKSYEVDKTYGLERLGTITDDQVTNAPAIGTDAPRTAR
jgi:hypothetical protein